MSLETDLVAYLLADSGVASALGTKVFRQVADQDAGFPYATLASLSVEPQRTLAGPNGEAIARLQITCWADTLAGAETARDAVRAALRALERQIATAHSPALLGSTRIRDVTDDSDQEAYEDEVRQPRRLLEITIRYEE